MRFLKVFGALIVPHGVLLAADKGPEIQVVDGKISITAEAVPLGRLLSLWDKAWSNETSSTVKPELANQNISVQFVGLPFEDAVQKIFQGQPLNYIVVGRGIRVTERAAAMTGTSSPITTTTYAEPPPISSSPLLQPPSAPLTNTASPFNPAGGAPGNPAPAANAPSAPTLGPGGVAPVTITPLGGGPSAGAPSTGAPSAGAPSAPTVSR
jgi:hypothetical protein